MYYVCTENVRYNVPPCFDNEKNKLSLILRLDSFRKNFLNGVMNMILNWECNVLWKKHDDTRMNIKHVNGLYSASPSVISKVKFLFKSAYKNWKCETFINLLKNAFNTLLSNCLGKFRPSNGLVRSTAQHLTQLNWGIPCILPFTNLHNYKINLSFFFSS